MTSFKHLPNRHNTRSVKWDKVKAIYGDADVQPLWVADMDLEIAEPIKQALKDRVDHGVFGYTFTDDLLDQLVTNWLDTQHDFNVSTASLIYSPGVLETIHMTILTQTEEHDKVLIQTPVYFPFHSMIKNHNRELVKNPLINTNGHYTIDFEDLEAKFKDGVKAMIFCSPHNPVGRVWTEPELKRVLELAEAYNVLIISDEIHADLVYQGSKHIPIGSLDSPIQEQIITLMSPTKSFNLAGLQVSYAIVPDKKVRMQLRHAFSKYGITMLNTLGITALEAAYSNGKHWLDDLLKLLATNKQLVEDTFENEPLVQVTKAEGTYLLWLDLNALNLDHDTLKTWMETEAKLGLNSGITFGENGSGFMRMNIASPTAYIKEALDKLTDALAKHKKNA
ncbi:cystathionine beta-lyase [Streptohalobacillus salinus]|uniref:cysteine-S-conjugate beta-lyase n=1 Tax=Streptohalobacillus salinus TaxID=621096 RepID=A0A2V3WAF5_9BACI|nr:PatB family C-S lyase [Streptohalobacillus salinus]PXW91387.1 cystathionine beta-lyase [Streptohalobacillus salinus]